jgi:folate-dependent phosphoribosylglycinamide formyltransferase PurN
MEDPGGHYIPKSSAGTDQVNLVLIASGSGTDADAIMKAWKAGYLPEVNPPTLISTKRDAGCLEKARGLGLRCLIIDRRDHPHLDGFNETLRETLQAIFTDLVFLVGCVVKIYPISGMDLYNIHPADPEKFGGQNMYGLRVHEYVLRDVLDQIYRGRKTVRDRFFTFPTVHEVDEKFDSGQHLLRQDVEIPRRLIEALAEKRLSPEEGAGALQNVVLPYEWLMLPTAVKGAARRILERRKEE